MGVLSLISSPRPRVRGDKHSESSSEDSVESPFRGRKGLLPAVGIRWLRTQNESIPSRKEDKDLLSPLGRIRSLFTTPPSSRDEDSGCPSNRSTRLEPIDASQLVSVRAVNDYDNLRSSMPPKKLGRQATDILKIDPTDSPIFELVPGKLSFAAHGNSAHSRAHINHRPDLYFITSDLHCCSDSINVHDGIPVNLGAVFRFWEFMKTACSDYRSRGRRFVYYTDGNRWRNNATFLLACYMVLEHNMSTEAVVESLSQARSVSDIDADIALSAYLGALRKALEKSWLNVEGFDIDEYERSGEATGGAFSHFGDSFVVFPRPTEMNKVGRREGFSSVYYSNMLERMSAAAVVRINDPESYDNRPFLQRKILHYDLTFANLPSKTTVRHFLNLCDQQKGRLIGVHEQDGTSTSCTLVCLWMMRHLDFSAREAVAWVRLVRPGVVSFEQEKYLCAAEEGGWDGNWLQSPGIRSDEDVDPVEGTEDASSQA